MCFKVCMWGWFWFTKGLTTIEEIVSKFLGQFGITEEEQKVIVVDKHNVKSLKSSKLFLVGQINKESFKRQMRNNGTLKRVFLYLILKTNILLSDSTQHMSKLPSCAGWGMAF
ncbi:hypothetical protein DVH24_005712 [Malus domestica]|uniref:Uncharacterized protein n=1 Tax=Malus domestica TaxID=3750 RepID=A0A498IJW0_MALDO|nr:hypothetical protein DVH24_005712 [Malus domestica]